MIAGVKLFTIQAQSLLNGCLRLSQQGLLAVRLLNTFQTGFSQHQLRDRLAGVALGQFAHRLKGNTPDTGLIRGLLAQQGLNQLSIKALCLQAEGFLGAFIIMQKQGIGGL